MAIAHDVPVGQSRVSQILNTDFCPWANRFVYWLKEPVGWFVLAIAVSCMVGMYFSPVGWSIAAALTGLVTVGMLWPLVAVHATDISLRPEQDSVHEEASCLMLVRVRNRIPLPIWGLVVEGYLDRRHPGVELCEEDRPLPTVALASVPALSEGDYRINVQPTLRGHYPRKTPMIACSFPFAIYTARKPLKQTNALTVWPRVYSLSALPVLNGKALSEIGDGTRSGQHGDFIGMRAYRRGDATKNINWVASAKADSLMVIERGAPQTAAVDVWIDTQLGDGGEEELSRRARVAASVITLLHGRRVPANVLIGDRLLPLSKDPSSLINVMDRLASIPLEGACCARKQRSSNHPFIAVSSASEFDEPSTLLEVCNPADVRRANSGVHRWKIPMHGDLESLFQRLWQEIGHAETAA